MEKNMRALVLGGGGAKGAFQAGVFKYLAEQGEKFEIISGTSVGALNGSFLAQYVLGDEAKASQELISLWEKIEDKKIYKKWYFGILGKAPFLMPRWLGGKKSMFTTKPLENNISGLLDLERVRSSGHKLRINTINIDTGELEVFDEDFDLLKKAVLASSSFPPAFAPVEINGMRYLDAGAREIVPIEAAIKAGATDIVVIACSPYNVIGNLAKKPSGLDIAFRTIDASGVEIEKWDLKIVELYNALIKSDSPMAGDKKIIKVTVIRPKQALLSDTLDFNPERVRTNIERGYLAAQGLDKVLE